MVRAPCCEKMGLKKGPWTREEDDILINYIHLYGHGNWRALPKQAGLLRCGKSCRLRWTNYLRPDIKRGNFTREEEDTIIKLHQALGNRWSAIAARLPGRTDNEIKNVWHTHLKKRLKHIEAIDHEAKHCLTSIAKMEEEQESKSVSQTSYNELNSSQHSSSEISSATTITTDNSCMKEDIVVENFPEVDENFWSEVFSGGNYSETSDFLVDHGHTELELPFSTLYDNESGSGYKSNMHDDIDFWFNVLTRAGELPELREF